MHRKPEKSASNAKLGHLVNSSTKPGNSRFTRAKSGYIPTLDGWRAIAIAMVLVNHSPYRPEGPIVSRVIGAGALGVDLFFAISGLLICSRLLEEERLNGSINLGGFYLRRIFRIFPAAYLYLGVIAILALARIVPMDWSAWWSGALFYRNYFSSFVREGFLGRLDGHFWSLAVEEHFYLLLPAILILFPRRRILALSVLTIAAFTWLSVYVATTPPLARQISWDRRTDLRLQSLLFPALLALLLAIPAVRERFTRYVTPRNVAIVFLLIVAGLYLKHLHHIPEPPRSPIPDPANPGNFLPMKDTQLAPFPVFIAPIFLPFLILATVLHPGSWVSQFLELPALRAVGRISYSIYLWQQLFWVNVNYDAWPIRHIQNPLFGLCLTFVCAVLSYYLVEKPAIRLGHRLFPPATPGHASLDARPAAEPSRQHSHATLA